MFKSLDSIASVVGIFMYLTISKFKQVLRSRKGLTCNYHIRINKNNLSVHACTFFLLPTTNYTRWFLYILMLKNYGYISRHFTESVISCTLYIVLCGGRTMIVLFHFIRFVVRIGMLTDLDYHVGGFHFYSALNLGQLCLPHAALWHGEAFMGKHYFNTLTIT